MGYKGSVELKASEIKRQTITGVTTAGHTLNWTPVSEQSLIVTINGVKQHDSAYTISGTTLTLDAALVATDELEVIGLMDVGRPFTPAEGSVTNAHIDSGAAISQSKLATLAIDTAEIADDAVTADKLANSINTEIAANTAKVTNATHTGDVTGATALTIANDAVDIAMLSATGTASSSTFLRGDNAWAAAGGDNTPAFRAYSNSDQTIGTTSQTLVEMQTVEFDSDSDYDNTAGNYKWTPSVAGRYFVYARVNTNTALTTDSQYVGCSINKNGSGGPGDNNAWTKYGWPSVSTIVEMNGSSDYLQVYTQTNKSGGFQTYASSSGSSTSWFGFRLDGVS